MTDLTGSNSIITMLFPFTNSSVRLQDFTADESILSSAPDLTTGLFSLEGNLYNSKVYREKTITIKFLPTSPSLDYFYYWDEQMDLLKSSLGTGILDITSFNLGKRFIFINCCLANYNEPSIQETLGTVTVTMRCKPKSQKITL